MKSESKSEEIEEREKARRVKRRSVGGKNDAMSNRRVLTSAKYDEKKQNKVKNNKKLVFL